MLNFNFQSLGKIVRLRKHHVYLPQIGMLYTRQHHQFHIYLSILELRQAPILELRQAH